jgi:hypothetical protein
MADVTPREALSSSIRYWELRRILYNAALLLVVCTVYFLNLPASRQDLSFGLFEGLFVLAVLANVAYCAAHLVDVVAQLSAFRMQWLKLRWILLLAGSAFAAVLANFFSQGIFAHAT